MIEYIRATSNQEYTMAASLFNEYAEWLNIDLGFQHFSAELDQLKNMYGGSTGVIILAKEGEAFIGCVAIRPLANQVAELKRMFVKINQQRKGIGDGLLIRAIAFAEQAGYQTIRLDTLNNMTPAIELYKKYGFIEIPAYYYNPETTAVFFEKTL